MLRRTAHAILTLSAIAFLSAGMGAETDAPPSLKVHGIFSSHMVLQRGKPIRIWGWSTPGATVGVRLGEENAEATAGAEKGRWEVTFPAREASTEPLQLTVTSGADTVALQNIVIGDVWVMFGQSNMAFGLGKTQQGDIESLQAHLPLLREIRINPNEQSELQDDLRPGAVAGEGWTVATPKTVGNFSAIGFYFAARIQRALQIPIGIIDNARGGASLESLVPHHKFDDHPLAKRYAEHVAKRIEEFDPKAVVEAQWQKQIERAKRKNVPEEKWPKKPGVESLRSWSIPGKSPSDMASCYNGMFGVFKGYNIKGVLFHQGYNNAMGTNCRPKRYRVLMKLAIDGWREDFEDAALPVGIIGFCAGSIPQTEDNFEQWIDGGAPRIREAQRLGVDDVGDAKNTVFLPAYDVQIPGLHPHKKQPHGVRAARWALKSVYEQRVQWDSAHLVSAETEGDTMVLKFDKPVIPHDMSLLPKGFAIAGEDGTFYRAHARFKLKKDVGIWNTANKSYHGDTIYLWSPLVASPVAARYAWGASPMGNLYAGGKPWAPLPSFRTDEWDWPESDDPAVTVMTRAMSKERGQAAAAALETRKRQEAKMAEAILERLKTLGREAEHEE